jgi:colanic acid biosynthesis glycosyl transferase WcaI
MRITILNQFYIPGLAPTGHLAASLANHRADLGDRLTVITSRGGYISSEEVNRTGKQDNPRVVRAWTPSLGKSTAFKRIIDYGVFFVQAAFHLATLPRQDLVISLTTPPFIGLAAILHKLLHRRTKIVLWNMDCYPEILERTGVIKPGGVIDRLLLHVNRFIFARLDHLVCLDTAMLKLLTSRYISDREKPAASVIPNWEPLALFPPAMEPQHSDIPGELGIEGHFIVLYLGNAGFGHRFETVLEAAERLKDDAVDFLFVGGGEKWPWLERAIRARSLTNVHLHPYVAKELTPAIMAASNCALITMNEAALGVICPSKLHSNLAMRLPIIYVGPEGSNVDDAIQRFGAGCSLREGDMDGLVAFVHRIRSDPALHKQYAEKARHAFETAYVDSVTLPQFDLLIADLTRPV